MGQVHTVGRNRDTAHALRLRSPSADPGRAIRESRADYQASLSAPPQVGFTSDEPFHLGSVAQGSRLSFRPHSLGRQNLLWCGDPLTCTIPRRGPNSGSSQPPVWPPFPASHSSRPDLAGPPTTYPAKQKPWECSATGKCTDTQSSRFPESQMPLHVLGSHTSLKVPFHSSPAALPSPPINQNDMRFWLLAGGH